MAGGLELESFPRALGLVQSFSHFALNSEDHSLVRSLKDPSARGKLLSTQLSGF